MPRQSHRHHKTHSSRHRKKDRRAGSLASQPSEDTETSTSTHDTPSQRVQFILGSEEDAEHVTHELFTELDEICVKEGKDAEWKETARWLKFEEDVEDGGERWSKPYVATLSLHSLFELRSCLINGSVLLDMHADSIEEIAGIVLSGYKDDTESLKRGNFLELCTMPDNPSNKTLELWSQENITASAVPWGNLTVKECVSLQGQFVGTACGHHGPYTPDVLFWSAILFFATFFMSAFLKQFKTSRYFPTKVRSMISDFAVFLTIVVMVLLDYVIGIPSQKLQVPSKFQPTRDDRGWLINPIGRNPWWTVLAASIPALLCTILIFMDQQITAVIINRKEHKLLKGCGYHLDLLMVGVMLAVCSIMGLPWFVAATVLSISHVNSLKLESESSAPGEQPRFLGIREQRLTGLLIFLLMGCSVFMTGALQFIPMPVLYGVFLYMGASSLKGIQFFDRLKLFGMPAKHQPDFIYLRHVPLRKVHLFTLTQLTCLVLLWVIKTSPAAIVFPMMVLALVFIRKLLDLCFSKRELSYLDDLMPEWKKKNLDDASKKMDEESQVMLSSVKGGEETTVHIQMESSRLTQAPKPHDPRCDPSDINISDEMSKTTVWKALSSNQKDTRPGATKKD
ncbi:LOW QUALITY PROTEIN: electroneutral sodium bicarbonate exchanger 1 [Lampris incognitus]|uniref:LOW QUALITY PROTEIN: electroneutral sodium bicarbonate exchanger 1 n=1 Tax=Lampris incognitus TaxID=2546036 RepID=UPI0024B48BC3|nr:LOW QUALITY PROTEIN: electroneutral sodium bicarbonate exchanger 1 [Lampris incognitus]